MSDVKTVVFSPGALRAALEPSFGPRRFREFLESKGNPELLGSDAQGGRSTADLARRLGLPQAEARRLSRRLQAIDVDRALNELARMGARAITWGDASYPASVRRLYDPPPALFVRGGALPAEEPTVAIVGSRKASEYGLRMARNLAGDLARAGVTIVSGLARGIDVAAHEAALEGGGRTVAVLGSGLARPYPPEHVGLLERIVESGAVVSELPPDAPPRPLHFPRRNRIIAALSDAVLVVEAGRRSGALSTAAHATDLGVEVLTVPGPVDEEGALGTLCLLRDGATPVASMQDVLAAMGLCRRELLDLPDAEQAVLDAIGPQGATAADVNGALGFGVDAAAGYLVTLEVRGLISREEGGRYFER